VSVALYLHTIIRRLLCSSHRLSAAKHVPFSVHAALNPLPSSWSQRPLSHTAELAVRRRVIVSRCIFVLQLHDIPLRLLCLSCRFPEPENVLPSAHVTSAPSPPCCSHKLSLWQCGARGARLCRWILFSFLRCSRLRSL